MEEARRQENIARFNQYCHAVHATWAFQQEEGNHGAFLNSVRQLAEGIVGDLLEVMLAEKPDAVKIPREIRKGPLEGKLNAIRVNGYMDSRLHAHFSILRVCGNFGSHLQDASQDADLVKIAARSLRVCLKWYPEHCLKHAFNVEAFLQKSPSYIVFKPETEMETSSKLRPRPRTARRATGMLASLGSYLVQILTLLGGTLVLYLLLNRYGDSLLKLFGMGSP